MHSPTIQSGRLHGAAERILSEGIGRLDLEQLLSSLLHVRTGRFEDTHCITRK